MPANLTPQYHKAEEAYRRAQTPEEELRCLQDMLREIPKHKGTDRLQAELKQKISKLKKELETQKATGKRSHGIRIPRQGAGRVVIIGGPNGGKSQLLAALTRATPEIAPYPFTTREPQVGMMPWEDIMMQLIDTPPITSDVLEPYHQGLIRSADLVLLVVDLGSDDGIEHLQAVLERLNQTKTRLGRTSYLDENDLGLSFTRTIAVLNKIDEADAATREELLRESGELDFPECRISAVHGTGLEELKEAIYTALNVVRVYTKEPNRKEPDMDRPYTIGRGGTLLEVAAMIHKDFASNLKFARVWGSQVHPGTTVKGDYVLHDKDVIELHT
jgi:ribosome-interacting GTPase 1